MKILWSSNAPWSVSGYGQQTAMWTPRIRDLGHDIAILCFYGLEGATIKWEGMNCYPTDNTRFGNLLLGEYAEHHGDGDRGQVLVVTLYDVWVSMPGVQNFNDVRFCCWTPVDHDPCPPMVGEFLRAVQAKVIAMSRYGQKRLEQEGFEALYVPLGVDTEVFAPHPQFRDDYRDGLGIPRDAFVVGMVSHNQGIPPRKAFPQVFEAFAELRKRHNDAILYLHSDVYGRNNGVHLPALADSCGIPADAVRTTNQLMLHLGIPPDQMAGVFNAFDVLAIPSMGEGFGIPLVEAQACGCPVVTTDWTAMTELCGAGWMVDGQRVYDGTQRSYFKDPNIGELVDAFEEAYNHARDWELREQAREFALGYDTQHILDTYWRPALVELERPREIEPLRLVA